ncbi:MAG TPA: hypothetical protein VH650_09255 [Gaiellaceae bacterium]|jgi:hypothetical protein
MRRISLALAVCALVVAAAPGVAGAKTLAQRVNALEAKMSCLKRTGMSTYIGYAYYDDDGMGTVHALSDTTGFSDSGYVAAFGQGMGDTAPPDYWVVAVKNTPTCRRKLGLATNPYARPIVQRALLRANMLRLTRVE